MKFLTMVLVGVVTVSGAALAQNAGNKTEFMAFCSEKQSKEYCQCTMDFAFDAQKAQMLEHEKKKVSSREEQLKQARDYSIRLDPAMTVESLDAMCDVSDEFYDAKEAYYFELTGYKKPPSTEPYQREHVATLQKSAVAKMNALHKQYGSNETTIGHMNSLGGGSCIQRRMLIKERAVLDAYVEKDKKGEVKVEFRTIFSAGVSNGRSGCRELFVK